MREDGAASAGRQRLAVARPAGLRPDPLEIRVNEQRDESLEVDRRLPPELLARLRRIADEIVELRLPAPQRLVDVDVVLPVEADVLERACDELLDGMGLARWRSRSRRPRRAGASTTSRGRSRLPTPSRAARRGRRPTARPAAPPRSARPRARPCAGGSRAAPRRLVVVEDPRGGVQVVAAPVAADDEVRVRLRDAVGRHRRAAACAPSAAPPAARRRSRSRTPGRSGSRVDAPDRLEDRRHADSGELGGQHRLVPGGGHERDRGEVVELVRLDLAERVLERAPVEEVGADELDAVADPGEIRVVGRAAADDAEDLVPLSRSSSARRLPSWPPMPVTERDEYPRGSSAGVLAMRVAYTLEQCWHRVPGGTAVAALETARAPARAGRAGARRRLGVAPPPPEPPWRPPIPVRRLPVPPHVLYETWHRLRRPRVERATGPVDVIHATGVAVPPRSAPLVVTVHDLSYLVYPEHFSRQGGASSGRRSS